MIDDTNTTALNLAYDIASVYSVLPNVESVIMAGSHMSGHADDESDIDLYVYLRDDLTIDMRAVIAHNRASQPEINNQFWESGDEWIEVESDHSVDVMFRRKQWIEDQISQVVDWHTPSIGYSTSMWYNVRHSHILFDRNGWFLALQEHSKQAYPDALQSAIISKNYPILRTTISSYYAQLEKAIKRDDIVNINHRVAALLASYFDVLFAVNKTLHPGEKRLIAMCESLCEKRPPNMREQVEALVRTSNDANRQLLINAKALLDELDQLLHQEGLFPVED